MRYGKRALGLPVTGSKGPTVWRPGPPTCYGAAVTDRALALTWLYGTHGGWEWALGARWGPLAVAPYVRSPRARDVEALRCSVVQRMPAVRTHGQTQAA
jgi:hypothetical protein